MQAETLPIHQIQVEEEERLMTYQVTLCGSDGVVVASDRCEVWEEHGSIARTVNKVRKLFIDPSRQVAWTFSGGFLSGITAQLLAKNFPANVSESSVKDAIASCGNQACTYFRIQRSQTDILVAVIAPLRKILRARISPDTVLENIESGKCVSGQTDSLVNFFPDHFYSQKMPVKELATLAAYAVRMAHDLDPKYVDGLDIAVYRDADGEFDFVDPSLYWEHALLVDEELRECLRRSAIDIPQGA